MGWFPSVQCTVPLMLEFFPVWAESDEAIIDKINIITADFFICRYS